MSTQTRPDGQALSQETVPKNEEADALVMTLSDWQTRIRDNPDIPRTPAVREFLGLSAPTQALSSESDGRARDALGGYAASALPAKVSKPLKWRTFRV